MTATREQLVYKAKLAEQAERYDEMAEFMNQVAKMDGGELTIEERNLLSVAYKNAVGNRRSSWRIMSSVEHRQTAKQNVELAKQAREYRGTVEKELSHICEEILDLLDKHLISSAKSSESKVFYYKMKGDYYRYKSEIAEKSGKDAPTEAAREAYEEAMQIAEELAPTHPIRLGLALNYSVFYYEIKGEPDKACQMAQNAFSQAVDRLESVSDDSYRDSTLIMQLLRDNLSLWTSDTARDGVPGEGGERPEGGVAAGSNGKDAK